MSDIMKTNIDIYYCKSCYCCFINYDEHINNEVVFAFGSRISKIDFDCQSPEEEKFLKQEIYKKIFKE